MRHDTKDNLLKRLISQLDALVPFLALSHKDVFKLIKRDHGIWFSREDEKTLPSAYATYRKQVTHGAFLLGYSYSEAFLSDLVRQIYRHNPCMLPNEKELKFSELHKVKSYNAVLNLMIEKEAASVFNQGMKFISDYFKRKLTISWPEEEENKAIVASLLRNCIIHNLSVADSRLAEISEYNVGDVIDLKPSDVHLYGLAMRTLARNIYTCAHRSFLKRTKADRL